MLGTRLESGKEFGDPVMPISIGTSSFDHSATADAVSEVSRLGSVPTGESDPVMDVEDTSAVYENVQHHADPLDRGGQKTQQHVSSVKPTETAPLDLQSNIAPISDISAATETDQLSQPHADINDGSYSLGRSNIPAYRPVDNLSAIQHKPEFQGVSQPLDLHTSPEHQIDSAHNLDSRPELRTQSAYISSPSSTLDHHSDFSHLRKTILVLEF